MSLNRLFLGELTLANVYQVEDIPSRKRCVRITNHALAYPVVVVATRLLKSDKNSTPFTTEEHLPRVFSSLTFNKNKKIYLTNKFNKKTS